MKRILPRHFFYLTIGLQLFLPALLWAAPATNCPAVGVCIAKYVGPTVVGCLRQTPACIDGQDDGFALSAAALGANAISGRKCDTKRFRTKQSCKTCFATAKLLITDRENAALYEGLIPRAVSEISKAALLKCNKVSAH